MDGVICNFNKRFQELQSDLPDHQKFRDAVLKHNIFEDLEFMPDAQELLNHVSRLQGVTIEILTSVGTYDPHRGQVAKMQKMNWLDKKNIPYRSNFVRSKPEKSQFATPTSILIDDSIGCITPFNEKGGHGILHTSASETNRILDSTLLQIRTLEALHNA
jgi:hypothetical protein